MSIISFLTNIVYRSLFLTEKSRFQKTSLIVKIIFSATLIYAYVCSLSKPLLLIHTFCLLVVLSTIDRGFWWFISVTTLASIPGLWFSATAYVLQVVESGDTSIYTPIVVFSRTVILTHIAVFTYSLINPVELYNILLKTSLRKYAVSVLLTYRLIPLGLSSFNESISISKLKKEKIVNRLSPAVASLLETASYIKEYCFFKINKEPEKPIEIEIDKTYTLILTLAIIINIIVTITFNSF